MKNILEAWNNDKRLYDMEHYFSNREKLVTVSLTT